MLRRSTDSGLYKSDISAEIKGEQIYSDEKNWNSVLGRGNSTLQRPGGGKILENCSLFNVPRPHYIRGHVVRNRAEEVSEDHQFMKTLVKSC